MKKHSQRFKNEIKKLGKQLDSIISSGHAEPISNFWVSDKNYNINNDNLVWKFPNADELFNYEEYPVTEQHSFIFISYTDINNAAHTINIATSASILELNKSLKFDNMPSDLKEGYYLYEMILSINPLKTTGKLLYCFEYPEFLNEKSIRLEESKNAKVIDLDIPYIKDKNFENYLYIGDEIVIKLENEQLNAVTPVLQSELLKSVMKELDVDSNVEIPVGTIINYKFGVLLDSGDYEYLDYGNYQVYSSEKQEDTNSYNIVAYDKMLNSMVKYTTLKDTSKPFPMTVRDYIQAICNDINITFKDVETEFANYDKVIESDLYANLGYTYRDILDELAQVTASNIIINDNDELEIKYITDTGDTIDEEYLKDINVKFGEKYGPINSIVLSRSAESDNVYLQDEQSVAGNGLHELKIIDNQIMNFNDRSNYLPAILEKLNGLEFYINDFSSTGVCYYEIADKYGVKIDENTYSCVMFNDQINVTQGLEEIIHTDLPEQAETDYTKADKTDRRINQAYLIVDKQNQTIESLVSQVDGQNERITKAEQTVDGFSQTVSSIETTANEAKKTADDTKKDLQDNYSTAEQMNSAITQSAEAIQQSVSDQIKDAEGNILQDVNGQLDLYIKKKDTGEVVSAFNLATNEVVINSDNFKLDAKGNITANNASLNNVTIKKGNIELEDTGTYDEYRISISSTGTLQGYYNEIGSRKIKLYTNSNDTCSSISSDEFLIKTNGIFGSERNLFRIMATIAAYVYLYNRDNNSTITLDGQNGDITANNVKINDTPTASNHAVRLQDLDNFISSNRYVIPLNNENIRNLQSGLYYREGNTGWVENGWPHVTWHATLIVTNSIGPLGWKTLIMIDNSANELWLQSQQYDEWSDWKKIG